MIIFASRMMLQIEWLNRKCQGNYSTTEQWSKARVPHHLATHETTNPSFAEDFFFPVFTSPMIRHQLWFTLSCHRTLASIHSSAQNQLIEEVRSIRVNLSDTLESFVTIRNQGRSPNMICCNMWGQYKQVTRCGADSDVKQEVWDTAEWTTWRQVEG